MFFPLALYLLKFYFFPSSAAGYPGQHGKYFEGNVQNFFIPPPPQNQPSGESDSDYDEIPEDPHSNCSSCQGELGMYCITVLALNDCISLYVFFLLCVNI